MMASGFDDAQLRTIEVLVDRTCALLEATQAQRDALLIAAEDILRYLDDPAWAYRQNRETLCVAARLAIDQAKAAQAEEAVTRLENERLLAQSKW